MTGIWAAVPVKEFSQAKQRLSAMLSPAQRQALVAAMLEDVLAALATSPVAGIIVNTVDSRATEIAHRFGARVVTISARDGHSGAVGAIAKVLAAERGAGMLTCPGDIPGLRPEDIATLLAAHSAAPAFTIAPAYDSRGSNGIILSPPTLLPLQFGDDSFLPHLDAARRCNVEPAVLRLPGFAHDIDNPADVRAFLHAGLGEGTRSLKLLKEFSALG